MVSRHKLAIGAVVGLLLLTLVLFLTTRSDGYKNVPPPQVTYQNQKIGVEVRYPDGMNTQLLSEQDKKDNIILRLTEVKGQSPLLVTLRYEDGLKGIAKQTNSSIIDMIMANSEKTLPQRFEGFRQESSRRYEHKGRHAGEIIFTYDSPVPNERVKQRFNVFVKDEDTVVYLAMQAKEADFALQNRQVFDNLADSIVFR